jgi:hypothetical protein
MQAEKKPGEAVRIQYVQMGIPKQSDVILIEDPTLQVVTFEELNRPVTQQIKTFRQNWLESKVSR